MYQIFADSSLIYDSTLDDYKIGKGQITKEVDKSGSFVFTLYPDHPYYDRFVKLKTVVLVRKSGKVAFRGRVLNDVGDYWNTGTFTCEGELGFLNDSVVRPFEFTGTPEALFRKFIEEHNAQVDAFKRFKVGTVTVADPNNYINRSTAEYPTTLAVLQSALTGSDLGGHIYITHGDDGTEELPTIHYVADFPNTATQSIEFGVNLKDYTKTVKAEDVATAIIPLGAETETTGQRLTIASVNGGVDYVYDADAVAAYGWVFKTVVWDDVVLAQNLLTKARAYLAAAVNQCVTIELTAIDLHLLDRSVESFNVCDYVHVCSVPHKFDAVMLCNKQTMDLLKPDSDTVTLGYQTTTFTGASTQMVANVSTLGKRITEVKQDADAIALKAADLEKGLETTLKVDADGVTITDAEGNEVTINGKQIAAYSITADKIKADELHVNAANIDGTLRADQVVMTGAITWADLSSGVQSTINAAYNSGGVTENQVTVITQNAIATASISANQITTGTLTAQNAYGQTAISLSGLLGLLYGGSYYGYVGASTAGTYAGAVLADSSMNNYFIATTGGARMSAANQSEIYVITNGCYCTSAMQVASDKGLKNSIEYDMEKYEGLFKSLKPCSYYLNRETDAKRHWGFIAQDFAEGITAAGFEEIGLAALGHDGEHYSIGYTELVPLNTHMIQKIIKALATLGVTV